MGRHPLFRLVRFRPTERVWLQMQTLLGIPLPLDGFDGAALLVPVPQGRSLDEILGALVNAGVSVRGRALVGSHARRYMVSASGHLAPVDQ